MVREIVAANCGIIFDKTAIDECQWHIEEEDIPQHMIRGLNKSESAIGKWVTGKTYDNSGKKHRSDLGTVNPNKSNASAANKIFNRDDALEDKGDKLRFKSLKAIWWWIFEMSFTFYEWQDQEGKWWKQLG